ncbi:nucleotidyltransferase domain-containing protein [bacterium]|nr:nucleotidyltransferase domain-containing protein [bacterium]
MNAIIEEQKNELNDLCRALNVRRLYVFGSVVSNDFNDESDLDFLVSFADGLNIEEYTNGYFLLHYKLRALFNREIDVVTERSLSNPYFIQSINETKQLIYEA